MPRLVLVGNRPSSARLASPSPLATAFLLKHSTSHDEVGRPPWRSHFESSCICGSELLFESFLACLASSLGPTACRQPPLFFQREILHCLELPVSAAYSDAAPRRGVPSFVPWCPFYAVLSFARSHRVSTPHCSLRSASRAEAQPGRLRLICTPSARGFSPCVSLHYSNPLAGLSSATSRLVNVSQLFHLFVELLHFLIALPAWP